MYMKKKGELDMSEEKNVEIQEEELDLDDLEQVSGGSLRDTRKKKTTDVSDSTLEQLNQ